MNIKINQILFGKYQIVDKLGSGTFGTVYLAKHLFLETYRALKVIPKSGARSILPLNEAKMLTSIQHPGIPIIYDVEEDITAYYLIEEYVQGESLDSFLLHQNSLSKKLFFNLCNQVLDIFLYLHEQKPNPILYQDLKPEHIMISGLTIQLIDFGISQFVTSNGKTRQNFGNQAFSDPLTFQSGLLDLSADQYSIGKFFEYLSRFVAEPLPEEFHQITKKSTNSNPLDRFETVANLKDAFEKIQINNGVVNLTKKIVVIGAASGCGCTHIAISLAEVLLYLGYSSYYREYNDSNHLRKCKYFQPQMRERNNCFYYRCFKGYPNYGPGVSISYPKTIAVLDCGTSIDDAELNSADLILFVTNGAIWNRNDAIEKYELLSKYSDKLRVITNMTLKQNCLFYVRNLSSNVYGYPYDPDLFQVNDIKLDFFRETLNVKGREETFLKRKFRKLRKLSASVDIHTILE